jgi:hypothetical protein
MRLGQVPSHEPVGDSTIPRTRSILKVFPIVNVPKMRRAFHAGILIKGRVQFEKAKMSLPEDSSWKTRLVERGFPDRSFDIEFWQGLGDEAIFAAAWEMVELAEEINHGRKPTLQRTATTLKRIRG